MIIVVWASQSVALREIKSQLITLTVSVFMMNTFPESSFIILEGFHVALGVELEPDM